MRYIKKYKKFICEQFNVSKNDIKIENDDDLIEVLKKNYMKLISSKNDLLVEKIKQNDKLIRNKPLELENIFITAYSLIITIMMTFVHYFNIPPEVAYNILLMIVCILIIATSIIKASQHISSGYHKGYHNMCLMVLEMIENEYKEKNDAIQKKVYEQELDNISKDMNDIKKFIGIR